MPPAPTPGTARTVEAARAWLQREQQRDRTADPARARRLARAIAVLATLPRDAASTQHLVDACLSPGGDSAATRLHAALIAGDAMAAPLDQLLGFTGLGAKRAQARHPQHIFAESAAVGELLDGLLLECANPSAIRQGDRHSGAAAACQVLRAWEAPGDYARLVVSLAVSGQARLAGGGMLQRLDDWSVRPFDGTLASRLVQPALMQLALGEPRWGRGLDWEECVRLLGAVTGRRFAALPVRMFDARRGGFTTLRPALEEVAFASLLANLRQHVVVPMTIAPDPTRNAGHYVLAARLDGEQVLVLDLQGGYRHVGLGALKATVVDLFFREGIKAETRPGLFARGTRPLTEADMAPLFDAQNPRPALKKQKR